MGVHRSNGLSLASHEVMSVSVSICKGRGAERDSGSSKTEAAGILGRVHYTEATPNRFSTGHAPTSDTDKGTLSIQQHITGQLRPLAKGYPILHKQSGSQISINNGKLQLFQRVKVLPSTQFQIGVCRSQEIPVRFFVTKYSDQGSQGIGLVRLGLSKGFRPCE